MAINSVAIVGTGNMAENLIRSFQTAMVQITGLYGRDKDKASTLCDRYQINQFSEYSELPSDSLIILAISDDAIESVSQYIPKDRPVVHTSGSAPMSNLKNEKAGVFYPLQTMTSSRKIDFFKVPLLIEANNKDLLLDLKMLGTRMTDKVRIVDSEKRKKIHLAAVILNNFVTELVKLSDDFMDQIEAEKDLLRPLLEETVSKIQDLGADKALTGPAKRRDQKTINGHLEMLDGDLKEVYQLLSNIILKENGKL